MGVVQCVEKCVVQCGEVCVAGFMCWKVCGMVW